MEVGKKKKSRKTDVIQLSKRALEHMRAGRFDDSEKCYARALGVDPMKVYVLVGLGDLKRRQKHFQKAVDYYRDCLDVEEDNLYALAGLGDAYRGLRNLDQALEIWLRYLTLKPGDYRIMTRMSQ